MTTAAATPGSSVVSLAARVSGVPEELTIVGPVYEGGEARVYFSNEGQYAVKLYRRSDPTKARLLQQVMQIGQSLGDDARFLVWPQGIVSTLNGVPGVGCITRRVPSSFVTLMDLMMSPRLAVQQFRSGRTWAHYLKIAREVAAAVKVLHGKGCAHADLHFKNFLANPATAEAVLLDLDGLVVQGFLPPQVKGMRGFMAPEVEMDQREPGELTDRHSVAVLILYTLLLRNPLQPLICYDVNDQNRDEQLGWGEHATFSEHPTDTRNRLPRLGEPFYGGGALSYRMLPPPLQRLAERTLIDGLHQPERRPLVAEWETALAGALDQVHRCHHCRQFYPYPFWAHPPAERTCPFCGSQLQPPYPVVLELLDPKARGMYDRSRHLILAHGYKIYGDAVEPTRVPPVSREGQTAVGHVEWHPGAQVLALFNDEAGTWTAIPPGGRPPVRVGRGQAVPLQAGLQVHFGPGSRLARVVE